MQPVEYCSIIPCRTSLTTGLVNTLGDMTHQQRFQITKLNKLNKYGKLGYPMCTFKGVSWMIFMYSYLNIFIWLNKMWTWLWKKPPQLISGAFNADVKLTLFHPVLPVLASVEMISVTSDLLPFGNAVFYISWKSKLLKVKIRKRSGW